MVLLETGDELVKLDVVLLLKKWHQALNHSHEDWLLFFQDIQAWELAQLKSINETSILDISKSPIGLNLESSLYSASESVTSVEELHHLKVDPLGSSSLSKLNVTHHEMLFICKNQHVSKISLEFLSEQESSHNLLYFDNFVSSLIKIYFGQVS